MDEIEKYLTELSEKIDKYDTKDQKFIFWYILKNTYIPELEKELQENNYNNAKDKKDCMYVTALVNELKALKQTELYLLHDLFN